MSRGAPPGARDNGLPTTSWWAPLGECDPRVTEHLLEQLAAAAIPAYAQPSTGSRGSYLELRPPRRPMDSVYVDNGALSAARELLAGQLGDGEPPADAPREAEPRSDGPAADGTTAPDRAGDLPGADHAAENADDKIDELFAAIIARFHEPEGVQPGEPGVDDPGQLGSGNATATKPSPTAGDRGNRDVRPRTRSDRSSTGDEAGAPPRRRRTDREPGLLDPGGLLHDSPIGEGRPPRGIDPFEGDDEHFERPPVEPGPPMHPVTKMSVIAIVAGILLLLAPAITTLSDLGVSSTIGALLVAGGTVGLVVRLRDDPPDDRGDGGAVV
jgi:hypothetical protein